MGTLFYRLKNATWASTFVILLAGGALLLATPIAVLAQAQHAEKLPRVRATVDVVEPGQRVETILDRVQLKHERIEQRGINGERRTVIKEHLKGERLKDHAKREHLRDNLTTARTQATERVEKKRDTREQLNETRAYQRREEIRERIRERIIERVRERREDK